MTDKEIDISTATWTVLKEVMEDHITEAQKILEKTGLGVAETEFQRGRISAMRKILDLASNKKPVVYEFEPS